MLKEPNKILSSESKYFHFELILLSLLSILNEIYNGNSEISLIINTKGFQNILNDFFYIEPSDIIVNGISMKDYCGKQCNLSDNYNNVTLIFEEQIDSCENMFEDLTNIIEIDFSKFDFSKITNMKSMFKGCTSLEKVNFGDADTSSVESMEELFYECKNLKSIDLAKFNTSKVTTLRRLFSSCESIKSIDLSNFDTSKVENMFDIFAYCYQLISVNLSSFDTSKCKNMQGLFYRCLNIKYLDLPNFDASSAENINYIFSSMESLEYLNLCSFRTNLPIELLSPKYLVKDSKVINNTSGNEFSNCDNICINRNLKIDIVNNECVLECDVNKFEYKNLCNDHCIQDFPSLISNKKICLEEIPENFYFDSDDGIYKECFDKCKKCNKSGNETNNNCDECKDDLIFITDITNNNCYEKCQFFYYFNEINQYYCTLDNSCPETYKLIEEKRKCITECKNDDLYIYEYNNNCYKQCPNGTIENDLDKICYNISEKISTILLLNESYTNEIDSTIGKETEKFIELKTTSEIIETEYSIQETLLNETYLSKESTKTEIIYKIMDSLLNILNIEYLDKGHDIEVIEQNILITFTTTQNQKYNENQNKTTINLGECENIIKNNYNISENNSLYIIKLDIEEEGMQIPKIEYEVYYPLYIQNFSKLNISLCQGMEVELTIPIKIDDDIDKYNSSSDYYNNICSKTTSKRGTDITLNDRKIEFINNNMTLCEENCDLIDYDYRLKKAKCSCLIKIKIPFIEEIKFDMKELLYRFKDIRNLLNLNVMKCFKNVFNKSIKSNYGFYIIILIFMLYLICLIIFTFQSFYMLKHDIANILFSLKIKEQNKNLKFLNLKQNLLKLDVITVSQLNFIYSEYNINKNYNNITEKVKSNALIFETGQKNTDSKKKLIFKDFELNDMKYKEALKFDQRNYIQCYWGLLKTNHIFLFSFLENNDYNSRIIKIFLFFFFMTIDLVINALFFNNETMHKIYEDEGSYNFVYQIPQIIYSSILSIIVNIFIKYLALSQSDIIEFKQEKKKREFNKKYAILIKNLKIKFTMFFIISFILIIFFCYYISCFCGIYQNTQIHLFKDTIISFITSLIFPFGIYLIPTLLRINAIKFKKKYIYNISQLFQLI